MRSEIEQFLTGRLFVPKVYGTIFVIGVLIGIIQGW